VLGSAQLKHVGLCIHVVDIRHPVDW
jgi:hypothetical protein